jgi:Bacterial aa3 type cytochrome c oxidase subunit IV
MAIAAFGPISYEDAALKFRDSSMASHSSPSSPAPKPGSAEDYATHKATYQGFLDFSVAGSLICLYIVVALVVFRFVDNPFNLPLGFGGIIIGILTSIIALRMGGKWMLPVAVLVLYGLFTAMNVHMS